MSKRSINLFKRESLRAQIEAGLEALDRGEFKEVPDTDLEHYLEELATRAGKRTH